MMAKLLYPANFYIEVVTLNKGKKVGKVFFDKNPDLLANYPSIAEVQIAYVTVLNHVTSTGKHHRIIVSETGIKITVQANASIDRS